jgi:hypothetical protein
MSGLRFSGRWLRGKKMNCKNCGGSMIGDGYNSRIECENYEGEDCAPDASPAYCDDTVVVVEMNDVAEIIEGYL